MWICPECGLEVDAEICDICGYPKEIADCEALFFAPEPNPDAELSQSASLQFPLTQ